MLWWQCCCLRNAKEEYNMERTVKKESHCRRMKRRDLQAQNSKVRESVESNRSDAPEEQETGQASWHTFSYNPHDLLSDRLSLSIPFDIECPNVLSSSIRSTKKYTPNTQSWNQHTHVSFPWILSSWEPFFLAFSVTASLPELRFLFREQRRIYTWPELERLLFRSQQENNRKKVQKKGIEASKFDPASNTGH